MDEALKSGELVCGHREPPECHSARQGKRHPAQQGKSWEQYEGKAIMTLRALLPSRAGHGAGEPRTGQTADAPEGEEGSCSVRGEEGGQGQTLSVQFVLATWCLE